MGIGRVLIRSIESVESGLRLLLVNLLNQVILER